MAATTGRILSLPSRLGSYYSHIAAYIVDVNSASVPFGHGQFTVKMKPAHHPVAVSFHYALAVGSVFVAYGVDPQPAHSFLAHLLINV